MDRMMFICFFILCVVDFSWAREKHEVKGFGAEKSDFCKPDPAKSYNCEIRNHIPGYIWYILGFISILLFVESILLIYVLVKTKFLRTWNICNRKTKTLTPEKLEDLCALSERYQTITAGANNSDKTTSLLKNENEHNKILKRQGSQVTIASNYNTLRTTKKTEASGNISPRIIKGVGKEMPIILPEQMSLICKEVLKRTGNHDSTGSLQNIDKLVNEGKPTEETVSKCASTPALDLYDNLPTPHCNEKHKTEKPIISPENMSLICKEVLQHTLNQDSDSTSQSLDELKEGKSTKETVATCDEKNGKEKDAVNEKSSTLCINSEDNDSDTSCEIYDSPKMLDYIQDSIYDLPKDSASKVENERNYITPYFSANPSVSDTFKAKEEKLDYASIDTEKKGNIINECDSPNDCEYEYPKSNSQNPLYTNANEVQKT